ncbi:MAG: phosphate signaling complex protein PhoU [Bdellovibrionales bacterium]|nr:phosphate signaling complex protein PhoU [Bdellovibrionales bacterium]
MDRSIDSGMAKLKDKLLLMGGYVEKAIEESTQGLVEGKQDGFTRVHEFEKTINQLHKEVDEDCLNLLATQSPMARDLRTILAVVKINTDLERMGDQAVNIALNAVEYLRAPPIKPLIDIPRMADISRVMAREALDAFVRTDLPLAEKVLERDDEVDNLKNQIFRELITYMISDPKKIEQAISLILIARNLERVGDHATNIAEDVIFIGTGKDVRHGGSP